MYTLRASLLFSLTSLLLPTFILATPTPTRRGRPEPYEPPCNSCLNPNEIYPIASRWLNVFATDGLAGLDMATTEDVQYWNEEFTYPGSPEPYANNRTQLAERIGYSAGTWTACEKISFEIVSAWNSCDRIAVRWKQHAVVSGDYKQA